MRAQIDMPQVLRAEPPVTCAEILGRLGGVLGDIASNGVRAHLFLARRAVQLSNIDLLAEAHRNWSIAFAKRIDHQPDLCGRFCDRLGEYLTRCLDVRRVESVARTVEANDGVKV